MAGVTISIPCGTRIGGKSRRFSVTMQPAPPTTAAASTCSSSSSGRPEGSLQAFPSGHDRVPEVQTHLLRKMSGTTPRLFSWTASVHEFQLFVDLHFQEDRFAEHEAVGALECQRQKGVSQSARPEDTAVEERSEHCCVRSPSGRAASAGSFSAGSFRALGR